jgi:hypothetical protein
VSHEARSTFRPAVDRLPLPLRRLLMMRQHRSQIEIRNYDGAWTRTVYAICAYDASSAPVIVFRVQVAGQCAFAFLNHPFRKFKS